MRSPRAVPECVPCTLPHVFDRVQFPVEAG